jgi:hypothetical protein
VTPSRDAGEASRWTLGIVNGLPGLYRHETGRLL